MPDGKHIRESFAKQAMWCEQLGSPFTARLLLGLGQHLNRNSKTGRRVLDWQGRADALGDAVALRLAGALNAQVRQGGLQGLAKHYPPYSLPSIEVLTDAALAAIDQADDEICRWLDFAPQTNEVARAAVLYPGLCQIAQETGLPLAVYELGASGGLNLFADRFAYHFGAEVRGKPNSTVILKPEWSGGSPPVATPQIIRRKGCDRSPLDVSRADHRARLMAYIWPDQAERIARITAAISIAQKDPPEVAQAEVADWVEEQIEPEPETGVTRVLFHSIAHQYFPDTAKQRISERMRAAGERATDDAPLAWLAFEQKSDWGPHLTLRLWPGGKLRELAVAGAHVHKVDWKG